jgi:hypothetical protein
VKTSQVFAERTCEVFENKKSRCINAAALFVCGFFVLSRHHHGFGRFNRPNQDALKGHDMGTNSTSLEETTVTAPLTLVVGNLVLFVIARKSYLESLKADAFWLLGVMHRFFDFPNHR